MTAGKRKRVPSFRDNDGNAVPVTADIRLRFVSSDDADEIIRQLQAMAGARGMHLVRWNIRAERRRRTEPKP